MIKVADGRATTTPRERSWISALAVASLVANIGIVLTGGVVRLTASGLGCPSWPRCTPDSLTPRRELGVHGAIEFGNRMVTFLLAAVAVATLVAVWRSRSSLLRRLALVLALGVPAQAVIGGVSVRTDLNPWVVSLHLLVSLAMVGVAVALIRAARVGGESLGAAPVPDSIRWLVVGTFLTGWLVLYVGTVVTGSGPHAGDADAPRNGLDPRAVSQLHTDLVMLLLGLTVATFLALRAVSTAREMRLAAGALLGVEVGQAGVGFVQYATDLPIALVSVHLLGAALTSAALAWLLLSVRRARPRANVVGAVSA